MLKEFPIVENTLVINGRKRFGHGLELRPIGLKRRGLLAGLVRYSIENGLVNLHDR